MNTTPTATEIRNALIAAIAAAEAAAKAPEAKAKADRLTATAKAKRSEADRLTAELTEARKAAEAATEEEAEADPEAEASPEIRALFKAAKTAREAAAAAEEEAEAAEALASTTHKAFVTMLTGREIAVLFREKTAADSALTAAKKAANAAEAAAEALTADPTRPADPAAVKAAKKAANAARAKVTEARKAAAEAAKTAPRFDFFIGYEISEATERRPAAALAAAHSIAAATIAALKIDATEIRARWNVPECPEALTAAARTVAKRTAANAIQRQGTPTQFRIDLAARAARWNTDPDLADMVSEAEAAYMLTVCSEAAAAREAAAAARLHTYAATLAAIDPADLAARAAYIHRITTADRDPRIVNDAERMEARAAVIDLAIAARAAANPAEAADLATRAAFRAVNNYLTEARAIRTAATAPTVSLETIENTPDPRPILDDPEALTEFKARRRAIIKAAAPAFFEALTPAQIHVVRALCKAGGNIHEAARIANRDRNNLMKTRAIITRAFAAAIAEAAPNSFERRAADLARLTAEIESEAAAAALTAAKAEARAAAAREKTDRAAAATTATIAAALTAAKAEAATEAEAEKARRIAAAIAEAMEAFPPAMRETARLIASGKGKREAARLLGKSEATVRESARAAARRIAAAIAEAAPDLAINPDIVARADLAALISLSRAA